MISSPLNRARVLILIATLALLAATPVSAAAAHRPVQPSGSPTPVPITPGAWTALGAYGNNIGGGALNSHVYAIAVAGSNVYVGGNFVNAAGIPAADFVAKWDGTSWSALGSNGNNDGALNGPVYSLLVSGSNVYVGGDFFNAAGDPQADDLALWNGSTWSDIAGASGTGEGALSGQVYALAMNGSTLYIGGYFNNAAVMSGYGDANPGDMILSYDGSWNHLGFNYAPNPDNGALNGTVRALVATPTGVLAGGDFTDVAGDGSIDYLAEFTVSSGWTKVHGATPNGRVRALAQSSGGTYVGGDFTDFNGILAADYFVQWNGTGWTAPGGASGVSAMQATVHSIAAVGGTVYAGGDFLNAGGQPTADRLARWNGSAWSGLGSNGTGNGAIQEGGEGGLGWVRALALSSTALFAGGDFRNIANIAAGDYFAAYGIGMTTNQKPDGRIRKGSGSLVGNNIYNTTGVNQTRTGSAAVNGTITFTVSIQNDGTQTGKFKVGATASGNVNFQVTYFRGTTNITTAVVNGTYLTGNVAAGSTWAIKAKVKVTPSVVSGASTTRLITITSNADSSKIDAVKLIGKRT